MDDSQLIAAYVEQRSDTAFTDLVARHWPLVHRVCRRVLRVDGEADDAALATFVLLTRKAKGLRGRVSIAGWLHRAAELTARNAARLRKRRSHHEAEAASMNPTTTAVMPAAPGSYDDLHPLLDGAIAGLPDPIREALVMRYLHGMTEDAVATVLHCPRSTVSTRLAAGLGRLRAQLTQRGCTITEFGIVSALSLLGGTGTAELGGEALRSIVHQITTPSPDILRLLPRTNSMPIITVSVTAILAALTLTVSAVGANQPEPTVIAADPPTPTVMPAVQPIDISGAAPYPGAFTPNGAYFIFAMPMTPGQQVHRIMEVNIATAIVTELGRIGLQRPLVNPAMNLEVVMHPLAATNDRSHIFLAQGGYRLWDWRPATGEINALGRESDYDHAFNFVSGASADGRWMAVINDEDLIIIEGLSGAATAPERLAGTAEYLRDVHWCGQRLMWSDIWGNPTQRQQLRVIWPVAERAIFNAPLAEPEGDSPGSYKFLNVDSGGEALFARCTSSLRLAVMQTTTGTSQVTIVVEARPDFWLRYTSDSVTGGVVALQGATNTLGVVDCRWFDARGAEQGKAIPVDLTMGFSRVYDQSRAEVTQPKKQAVHPLVDQPTSIELLACSGKLLLVLLRKELRYGYFGSVYATMVAIDCRGKTPVVGEPSPVSTWESWGEATQVKDYPVVSIDQRRTAVATQLRDHLRIMPLR